MTGIGNAPQPPERSLTGQNLIQQVKKEPSFFSNPEFYKPFIFSALGVISAFAVGAAYAQFIADAGDIKLLVASLGIFAIISSLQIFLTKTFGNRIAAIVLQTVFMLLPLLAHNPAYLTATGVVVIFFILWGELLAYGELENGMEIRFFKVLHRFLRKFTTALALFMIIPYLPMWDAERAFIPKENFQNIYAWAGNAAKNFYPEVDFNSTFIALTRGLARVELQRNPAFRDLSDSGKETIIKQTADQIEENIGKSLGIEISPEDRTSDVFYNSILKLFADLKEKFKESFLFVWGLAIFLIIRGFGTLFYWIVMCISFILYELLLTTRFIHITGISKTHEVIDF